MLNVVAFMQSCFPINQNDADIQQKHESYKHREPDTGEVAKCTYLGSGIAVDSGTEEDVKSRIGKARTTFNIWKTIC